MLLSKHILYLFDAVVSIQATYLEECSYNKTKGRGILLYAEGKIGGATAGG